MGNGLYLTVPQKDKMRRLAVGFGWGKMVPQAAKFRLEATFLADTGLKGCEWDLAPMGRLAHGH